MSVHVSRRALLAPVTARGEATNCGKRGQAPFSQENPLVPTAVLLSCSSVRIGLAPTAVLFRPDRACPVRTPLWRSSTPKLRSVGTSPIPPERRSFPTAVLLSCSSVRIGLAPTAVLFRPDRACPDRTPLWRSRTRSVGAHPIPPG